MDERGYVTIVDRKKDMILVSGFNVYPNEIEDVIAMHPGRAGVRGVGVPDEKIGRGGARSSSCRRIPTLTEAGVLEHCREHLTGYKVPQDVEFRSELPKTQRRQDPAARAARRQCRRQGLKRAAHRRRRTASRAAIRASPYLTAPRSRLRDGREVTLRAIIAADAPEIVHAFERLSDESRYLRFMQHKKQLAEATVERGVNPRPGHDAAFVATIPAADGIDIVGAAQYVQAADETQGRTCEFQLPSPKTCAATASPRRCWNV